MCRPPASFHINGAYPFGGIGLYPEQDLVSVFRARPDFSEGSDVHKNVPPFSVDNTPFTVEPGGSHDVTVSFTPDQTGTFELILSITSNDRRSLSPQSR